jgi:hypothetical protein
MYKHNKPVITIKENPYNFTYQKQLMYLYQEQQGMEKTVEAATLYNSLPCHAGSLSTFGQFNYFKFKTGFVYSLKLYSAMVIMCLTLIDGSFDWYNKKL